MIQTETVQTYPFKVTANSEVVHQTTREHFIQLLEEMNTRRQKKISLTRAFSDYYDNTLRMFEREEILRKSGDPSANLFYHDKHHAVHQATYDAISICKGLLQRPSYLSRHLTDEVAMATILGAMHHDVGYVAIDGDCENYAARTPVHVERSIEVVAATIDEIKLPKSLEFSRVKRLAQIGIHATHFPFLAPRKAEYAALLQQFPIQERPEAMIVAKAVQLADLGGQVGRVDYNTAGLVNLRAEMNAANPQSNMGTIVIGQDHELAQKCRGFIEAMVFPTVGKTAKVLLGRNNPFERAWRRQIAS